MMNRENTAETKKWPAVCGTFPFAASCVLFPDLFICSQERFIRLRSESCVCTRRNIFIFFSESNKRRRKKLFQVMFWRGRTLNFTIETGGHEWEVRKKTKQSSISPRHRIQNLFSFDCLRTVLRTHRLKFHLCSLINLPFYSPHKLTDACRRGKN